MQWDYGECHTNVRLGISIGTVTLRNRKRQQGYGHRHRAAEQHTTLHDEDDVTGILWMRWCRRRRFQWSIYWGGPHAPVRCRTPREPPGTANNMDRITVVLVALVSWWWRFQEWSFRPRVLRVTNAHAHSCGVFIQFLIHNTSSPRLSHQPHNTWVTRWLVAMRHNT